LRLCYGGYFRRPHDSVLELVPNLHHLPDGACFFIGYGDIAEGVVQSRIEYFANFSKL
jgi:hypothetical protein